MLDQKLEAFIIFNICIICRNVTSPILDTDNFSYLFSSSFGYKFIILLIYKA